MKESNHEKRVKERLDRGLPITSLDAFNKLGIVHLPTVIRRLRIKGYPIEGQFIPVKNRFGERCTIKVFRKKEIPRGFAGVQESLL